MKFMDAKKNALSVLAEVYKSLERPEKAKMTLHRIVDMYNAGRIMGRFSKT